MLNAKDFRFIWTNSNGIFQYWHCYKKEIYIGSNNLVEIFKKISLEINDRIYSENSV